MLVSAWYLSVALSSQVYFNFKKKSSYEINAVLIYYLHDCVPPGGLNLSSSHCHRHHQERDNTVDTVRARQNPVNFLIYSQVNALCEKCEKLKIIFNGSRILRLIKVRERVRAKWRGFVLDRIGSCRAPAATTE